MDYTAKDLKIERIDARSANYFIKKWHYSHGFVMNSILHFGVFLGGSLHGVMSFGSSIDKRKMIGLVEGTGWHDFLELNRMAFDPILPRNSESRAISVALRLIKKTNPHIKWIVSFADACQCGTGTIYRASGFILTAIKKNKDVLILPDGTITHSFSLKPTINSKLYQKYGGAGKGVSAIMKEIGAKPLEGYQLRYIYFLDPESRSKLTVPEIPFSELDKLILPTGVRHKEYAKVVQ